MCIEPQKTSNNQSNPEREKQSWWYQDTRFQDILQVYSKTVLFFLRFYLFIQRKREREAESQAEGEAGYMQGARGGT